MDNGLIYNLLDTIIRKEKEGNTISPEQFTELLQLASLEKANSDFSMFENNQIVTDSLRLLKAEQAVTISNGIGSVGDLANYWHITNASHSITNYNIVPIDIVTDIEYNFRSYSDLERPTVNWPILKIKGDEIVVNPDSITEVNVLYLTLPNVPFFDYYINANDQIIYMEPGTDHTLDTDEEYRDGSTTGTVSSISVELSFPDNERINVLYLILQKLGISLNEQDAVEYGLMREQKEETQ